MDNFYIIANSQKDTDFALTDRISDYISAKGKKCCCQKTSFTGSKSLNLADSSLIPKDTECVIVLGGDGTLIQAARDLSNLDILVLGINIGTLGYLMEVGMDEAFEAVDRLIAGEFYVEERMLLEGKVLRNNEQIFSHIALNDIVLNRCGSLKIIDFDVYVNGEYLITYPADGLVVSTPTGSTAYNLSAGGPIVRPVTNIILMTPVCPHTINKSSVVYGGDDTLEIRMVKSRSDVEERVVSFDGNESIELKTDDRILISKSSKYAKIIRFGQHNFLQVLRNKLS